MPCSSDYLDPTGRERELQRAAKLLVFVYEQLDIKPPDYAVEDAKNPYCHRDTSVIALCQILHAMREDQIDAIVYNGRVKESRDLADWWDAHQEADRKREEVEALAKEQRRKTWEKLNAEFGKE